MIWPYNNATYGLIILQRTIPIIDQKINFRFWLFSMLTICGELVGGLAAFLALPGYRVY